MILLIDVGNTRVKWSTLVDDTLSPMSAVNYSNWDRAELDKQLMSSITRPERVLIANVGGATIGELLHEGIFAGWQLTPEFVHSTAQAAGVRNGYAIPKQLGVDRWLAVIGAFHLQHRPACVASVGTAMTIDGVDEQGFHLGGVIVPGPDLAIQSLLKNTSDLAIRSQVGEVVPALFAGNTLGAIHQGVSHMLAALIERSLLDMGARLAEPPKLLLTGGACERVAQSLRVPYLIVEDLVLQGLAAVARDSHWPSSGV